MRHTVSCLRRAVALPSRRARVTSPRWTLGLDLPEVEPRQSEEDSDIPALTNSEAIAKLELLAAVDPRRRRAYEARQREAAFANTTEPLFPSATLMWHYLDLARAFDQRFGGYCLLCRCSGHTTEACTMGHVEGETLFHNKHDPSNTGHGRAVCYTWQLYGICDQGDCQLDECVACGDMHPAFEHFRPRLGRPTLPMVLPPFQTSARVQTGRRRRTTTYEQVLRQELVRAEHTQAQQKLLGIYLQRAADEYRAFDAWTLQAQPSLGVLATHYPVFTDAIAARRAVADRIPVDAHSEASLLRRARTRQRAARMDNQGTEADRM